MKIEKEDRQSAAVDQRDYQISPYIDAGDGRGLDQQAAKMTESVDMSIFGQDIINKDARQSLNAHESEFNSFQDSDTII